MRLLTKLVAGMLLSVMVAATVWAMGIEFRYRRNVYRGLPQPDHLMRFVPPRRTPALRKA